LSMALLRMLCSKGLLSNSGTHEIMSNLTMTD
jgi:hypothetical protein